MGMNPYRGTGWAAGQTPAGHAPAQYTGAQQPYYGNQNNASVPPVYSPPPQNYGPQYGANESYFGGGQQNGVELQHPQGAYVRGGENMYAPPSGPPPMKKEGDGIIR